MNADIHKKQVEDLSEICFTLRQLKEMNTIKITSDTHKEQCDYWNKICKEDNAIDCDFFINEGVLKENYNSYSGYIYFKIDENNKNAHIGFYVYINYEFSHVFNINVNIEKLLLGYKHDGKCVVTNEKFIKNIKQLSEFIDTQITTFIATFVYLTYSMKNKEIIVKCVDTPKNTNKSIKNKSLVNKKKIVKLDFNTIKYEMILDEECCNFIKKRYERHTFGWTVRGHWREYKSGKKVWIKPQIRGDKDMVEGKVYEI